jgi:hypothetical protein
LFLKGTDESNAAGSARWLFRLVIQHHSYLNCTDLSSELVLRAAHHGVNPFGRWSQWLGRFGQLATGPVVVTGMRNDLTVKGAVSQPGKPGP